MELTQLAQPNVHKLDFQFNKDKKTFFTFHCSDIHFDSHYCRRDLLKKHLDYTKERNGFVFIYGDIFDVMGTYRDPRSKPQDIRPEYLKKGSQYLDSIVQDAFEFFKPYKDIILFMGLGNHETEIMKRHDTNILDKLAFMLRTDGGKCVMGGYSGYIRFDFKIGNTSLTQKLAYHHGKGGNAQRSKDILWSQLDAFQYSDADIIVSGHSHNKLHDPSNVKYRLNQKGKVMHDRIDWLKTGNYKRNESDPMYGGWEVQKGFLPKDVGGYFIEFSVFRDRKNGNDTSIIERMIYPAQ